MSSNRGALAEYTENRVLVRQVFAPTCNLRAMAGISSLSASQETCLMSNPPNNDTDKNNRPSEAKPVQQQQGQQQQGPSDKMQQQGDPAPAPAHPVNSPLSADAKH
jgi:hypothetical protein